MNFFSIYLQISTLREELQQLTSVWSLKLEEEKGRIQLEAVNIEKTSQLTISNLEETIKQLEKSHQETVTRLTEQHETDIQVWNFVNKVYKIVALSKFFFLYCEHWKEFIFGSNLDEFTDLETQFILFVLCPTTGQVWHKAFYKVGPDAGPQPTRVRQNPKIPLTLSAFPQWGHLRRQETKQQTIGEVISCWLSVTPLYLLSLLQLNLYWAWLSAFKIITFWPLW